MRKGQAETLFVIGVIGLFGIMAATMQNQFTYIDNKNYTFNNNYTILNVTAPATTSLPAANITNGTFGVGNYDFPNHVGIDTIGAINPTASLQVAGVTLAQGGNFTGTGASPDSLLDVGYVMPFGKYLYAYNIDNVSLRKVIGYSSGNKPELTVGQDATALITMMNFIAGNAGSFKFTVNNSAKLFINGTTGNVGIGTATPYSTLSIGGSTGFDMNSANSATPPNQTRPWLRVGGASNQNLNINGANSSSGVVALNADTAGNVWLALGGGKVGIGTASPLSTLDVIGPVRVNGSLGNINIGPPTLTFDRPSANYFSASNVNGYFVFDTNGRANSQALSAVTMAANNNVYLPNGGLCVTCQDNFNGVEVASTGSFALNMATATGVTATNVSNPTGILGAGVYSYEIVTVNSGGGLTNTSAEVNCTISGNGTDNTCFLSWNSVKGATSYRVYNATVNSTGESSYFTTANTTFNNTGNEIATGGNPPSSVTAYITKFAPNGANSWIIGNLSIGGYTANAPLYVSAPFSASPSIVVSGGSDYAVPAGEAMQFGSWNGNSYTEFARFNATGSFGIGTTSPQTFLHVNGAETANYGQLTIQGTANNELLSFINSVGARSAYLRVTGSDFVISNDAVGNMRFLVNNQSEKARFDSAGDFGIGTTNPNQKLEVVGCLRINNTDVIDLCGGTAGTFDRLDFKAVRDNMGSAFQLMPSGTSSMSKISLTNNGTIGTSNFSSAYIGVEGNTTRIAPQDVGTGFNTSVSDLIFGGGGNLGGSNWNNIRFNTNIGVNKVPSFSIDTTTSINAQTGYVLNGGSIISLSGNVPLIGNSGGWSRVDFYGNSTGVAMSILGNKQIGINTTSPNTQFQVVGNANITGNLYVTGCLKVNGTTYGTCI